MAFVFDSGYLFGVIQGGSNPTPVKFGSMQSIEANIELDLVKAPMQTQAPIGMLINGLGLKFKAKAAQINGLLFNQIFFGKQLSTGSQLLARDVALTVPAGSPFTVTPTVPGSGSFVQDLGVQYSINGQPLILVAGTPAAGQYAFSAGTYTFSSADFSKAMTACYLYSVAGGNKIALANSFKGVAPSFQCILSTTFNGKQVTWNLAKCISKQLQLVTALEKFSFPELSFEAIGDLTPPLGNIGTFSFSD